MSGKRLSKILLSIKVWTLKCCGKAGISAATIYIASKPNDEQKLIK